MNNNCECKDYSLLTANTGLATISTANPSLTGNGATLVLTAAHNGTIIKSVTIKAIQQVTKGMIRLFIKSPAGGGTFSLIKEVPIPIVPSTPNTPTPPFVYQMFEKRLDGEIKLQSGDMLYAATQNGESFNIIAEGLDWHYPALVQSGGSPYPGYNLETCCNFVQETANNGIGAVSTGSSSLTGAGSTLIYTAGSAVANANGSFIKTITIKALQSTNPGMVRLFIYNGSSYFLYREELIPETIQSGFEPSYKISINENLNLENGYYIYASTQLSQSFAVTIEGWDWLYPIA